MNRQARALLSVLLIGVVVVLAWRYLSTPPEDADGGSEISISNVSTRGGTLKSSLRSEPKSFNRIVDRSVPADLYSTFTGSKLVRVNRATQEVEPELAERWTTSPDNLTYTLTLRDGVTWSDGTPFTSADVVFTFQAIYDPKVDSLLASSLKIDGKPLIVTAPDPRTVVVTMPRTFGPGVAIFDNVHLAAKHKYQAALKAGTFGKALGVDTPPADLVSVGPFKLTTYAPGQRLVFDRNPRYWKKDAAGIQLPYLDQVILEIVPDQNAELVRLQSGQLDTLQQQVRPEDIATLRPLEQQGKLKLIELGVAADPDLFFFNLRSPYWAKDPRRDWITRKEFRHAISHAIDREAFANTVFLGAGVPVRGPVTPGNQKWFSPNIPRYDYSVSRAKEILAALGLKNRDADPWLEDAKGNEARFTLITYRGNSSLERGSAVIRDELKPLGIAVDVVLLEQGALVQKMLAGDFEAINFVANATSLDPAMNPDLWLSSGSAHVWNIGQSKPATEWEKEIDDLMATVMSSVDQAERKKAFDAVQKIVAEQLPVITFVAPRLYMGVSTRVGGITPAILRPQLLWNVERMTVKQDR
ncbi:MAG TPA: ABC transporter substrate-binding protein [Vicinamibacterales bacterium]|nr:ABC transporter substrate-binding protein [Vicinamibacterales bacterium]